MAQMTRITQKSDQIVEELHSITGKSRIAIIEMALEEFRFHERMRLYNKAFAQLKRNKESWDEEMQDRAEIEGTIADGLENE